MATIRETIQFVVDAAPAEQGSDAVAKAMDRVAKAEQNAQKAAEKLDDAMAKIGGTNANAAKSVRALSDAQKKAQVSTQGLASSVEAWKRQAESIATVGQRISKAVNVAVPIIGTAVAVLADMGIEFANVEEKAKAAAKRTEEFGKAARELLNLQADFSTRIGQLTGTDRADAIRAAIGVATKNTTSLQDGPRNNFANIEDARARFEKLTLEVERTNRELDRLVSIESRSGSDFGLDRALKSAREAQDALDRLRALPATIGGQDFVPVAQFDALAKSIPTVADEIKRLEAEGVPGLVRLADAFRLVRDAEKAVETEANLAGRSDRFRETLAGLKAQTNAQLDLNFAIEEGVASGLSAERAIERAGDALKERTLVQAALLKIEREGAAATEQQVRAIEREVRAFVNARDATRQLEEQLRASEQAASDFGQGLADGLEVAFDRIARLGGVTLDVATRAAKAVAGGIKDVGTPDPRIDRGTDAIQSLRLERAAILLTRDAVDLLAIAEQARRDELDATTAAALVAYAQQTQALARLREVADGTAGGIGDALRALKDGASGREALQAFASGAGDRIFEGSLSRLQEQISSSITSALGSLFGAPAVGPGITPGDTAIVTAVDQVRAAILSTAAAGTGGGGNGTTPTPAGFNFGGFLSTLGTGLLGLGLSQLGRQRGGGNGPGEAGFTPRSTSGGGSTSARTFQTVTINNYVSPDAKRLTPRQIAAGRDAIWKR